MALYTGRTSKYTRTARFTPHELAAIRDAKAQHKQSRPAEPTPPNLYNIGDKFYLADGSWKLKKIVGGYMTLEELDALGKAIRKTKKRAPRVIEITEGTFMEHIARQNAFQVRVMQAADRHWQDVQQARKEVPVEAQARAIHAQMWADCNRLELPITSLKVIEAVNTHTRANIIVGGIFLKGDVCWFRVQAPAYKLDNVKVAIHSIWPEAEITRSNYTLVVTVPRRLIAEKRDWLRSRLANLATAKAA